MPMDFTVDMTRVARRLSGLERQMPFITASTLTAIAKDVQAELQATMPKVFDRPTPYTLNSTFVRPATKAVLEAQVGFKDTTSKGTPASKYLRAEVRGGDRRTKRFERWFVAAGLIGPGEYLVPSKAVQLDAYGNVPASLITRVLSQLRVSPDVDQRKTMSTRSRKARRNERFFWWRGGQGKPRGVWVDQGRSIGVRPVFIVVKRSTYEARLPMFEIARRIVAERFQQRFVEAAAGALATAR